MVEWQYFPKSKRTPEMLLKVVEAFNKQDNEINSKDNKLSSNEVLEKIRPNLELHNFRVEKSKKKRDKIPVPVLFGKNGKPEKTFDVDAYHEEEQIVLEVEAGRAVTNNQFLKDLFQACMMVNVSHLAIAVRLDYLGRNDFDEVIKFMDSLYANNRLNLPLEGVLILGY